MYIYKTVQLNQNIQVNSNSELGNEAATYLLRIIENHAVDGFEFYRIDPIGVHSKPGCFGVLSGQKETLITYYVATFRKKVDESAG